MPADRGVVFSAGLETLAGWTMTAEAAKANKVVVAGQGEGTARLIRESADTGPVNTWGRAETFQDRRDTDRPRRVGQGRRRDTRRGGHPRDRRVLPPRDRGQAFGRDWALGDIVTVQAGGLTVIDQVPELHVALDDAGAPP